MRPPAPVAVHLYSTSGTVLCHGLELADVARPREDDPLRLTIYPEEVTCRVCRLAWERLQASAARA